MAAAHRPVAARPSFPELEQQVLQRWRERDVFAESVRRREGAPRWGFYEGPPTASGPPGFHHVLSRVFKDIFPRYRTMTGHYVERKAGWDCHGLPVELALEAELGFESKADIEAFGIAEFNARCRQKVLSHVDEWNRLTERIGFWVDLDDAYRTLDADYVESCWWALKTIHAKGLLYEKLKVVPYCPRDQVTLSSHELGQPGAYKDVTDPSVYVRLAVTDPRGPLRAGDELVVWTTTPWTLVSNAAVAVNPDLTVRARAARPDGRVQVVASDARHQGAGRAGADHSTTFAGATLVGTRYEPPFPYIPSDAYGPKGHTVLPADFVTADDGTGLVHTAIAFGDDDFRLGEEQGLKVVNPVAARRHLRRADRPVRGSQGQGLRPGPDRGPDAPRHAAAGRGLRPLLPALLALRDAAALLRQAVLVHRDQPDQGSAAGRQRDDQLVPGARQARPLRQLAGGQRRLGTVARALLGHAAAGLALRARLHEGDRLAGRARGASPGVKLDDPHRPYVDDVVLTCDNCGGDMHRVPEVIDVWFDSGSMPFAQYGASAARPRPISSSGSPPTSSARRSTRPAAGSTRCSRSRRCCSTVVLPQRRSASG